MADIVRRRNRRAIVGQMAGEYGGEDLCAASDVQAGRAGGGQEESHEGWQSAGAHQHAGQVQFAVRRQPDVEWLALLEHFNPPHSLVILYFLSALFSFICSLPHLQPSA